MTHWMHVGETVQDARLLADDHYSRKTKGARRFMPPGNKIVLMTHDMKCVWGLARNDPTSGILRRDGFVCWENTIFRKTSNCALASDLIKEAVAICIGFWGNIPQDGIHTFIDPKHVKTIKTHGEKTYGRTYVLAGFEHVGMTQGKLMRFVLSAEKMHAITPIIIPKQQPPLFEMDA